MAASLFHKREATVFSNELYKFLKPPIIIRFIFHRKKSSGYCVYVEKLRIPILLPENFSTKKPRIIFSPFTSKTAVLWSVFPKCKESSLLNGPEREPQTVWTGESCLSNIQFNIVYPPVLYPSTFPILTLLTGINFLSSFDDPKDGITTFLSETSVIYYKSTYT